VENRYTATLNNPFNYADGLAMSAVHNIVQLPDLKGVESFLMSLPYVTDASVWISKGKLLAHVTVPGFAPVVPNGIRAECLKSLGLHQTPAEVFLIVDQGLVA
jgi:hypothetical protein